VDKVEKHRTKGGEDDRLGYPLPRHIHSSRYSGILGHCGSSGFVAKVLFVVFFIGFVLMLAFGTWITSRIFGRR
jgi:hypothetical protein